MRRCVWIVALAGVCAMAGCSSETASRQRPPGALETSHAQHVGKPVTLASAQGTVPSAVPSPVVSWKAPARPAASPRTVLVAGTAQPRAAQPRASLSPSSPESSPSPMATTLFLAPEAAPQILDYRVSAASVHSGDTISGYVRTSSNVASVEVRIGGLGANMTKVGVDRFTVAYRVPVLPLYLRRRTYTLEIIARNASGDAVKRYVPITIQ